MSPTTVETAPYIGLRYFEERDAGLFYGRDQHVAELLGKMATNRFVAVIGSSGCGKSSLVRAGLLPELRSGMIPKAGSRWKVVEFRPGNAPLQELATAIWSDLGVGRARELVEEGPLGIARAVAEAKRDAGTNVLIIADQFEEVFRYQREESTRGGGPEAAEQCQALARRLLDAAAQAALPIYVLLVMRSDYLGECAQFPDLPEQMSESLYLVPRLRRDQLQEAIAAPVGGKIDSAVVQRLLGEVGSDPDQLPRLQHLLGRMWLKASGGRLTMQNYSEAGGWDRGLEQHLEEVYKGLSTSQQKSCMRIFQQLSELDKGRAVRRRAEISELLEVCGPYAQGVLDTFRKEGFFSPRENPVDITHECILREWPLARRWLDNEDRHARRLRELVEATKDAGWRPSLTPEQKRWVRELAGLTLQNLLVWRFEAEPTAAWARRYVTDDDFETSYDYLQMSEVRGQEAIRKAKEEEAEAFRRAEELEKQTILKAQEERRRLLEKAQERERQERDKRELRRTRIFATVCGVLAALAIVSAVWADQSQRQARRAQEVAMDAAVQATRAKENADSQREQAQQDKNKLAASLQLLSKVNNKDVRQALDSQPAAADLLPRVYMEIVNQADRDYANQIKQRLTASGVLVLGIEYVPKAAGLSKSEVRFYRKLDEPEAQKITELLKAAGAAPSPPKYLKDYENSTKVRPNHFEVWLANGGEAQ